MSTDAIEDMRAEIIEALGYMCAEAKREQCIVGTLAWPSRWDSIHHHINGLLDDLVGL